MFIATLLALACAGSASSTPMQWRTNAQRTGVMLGAAGPSAAADVVSSLQTAAPIFSTPALVEIGNGSVALVFGDDSGTVYRVDAGSAPGDELVQVWAHDFVGFGSVRASPAVADGRVFAAGLSGHVAALDLETGEALWTDRMDAGILASPLLLPDAVVFASSASEVHAYDLEDGHVLWGVTLGATIDAAPALTEDGSGVIVADRGGFVTIIDAKDASQVARRNVAPSGIIGTPAAALGRIFFGTVAGEVGAITPEAAVLFLDPLADGARIQGSPAVDTTRGVGFVGDDDGAVHAFSLTNGTRLWSFVTEGPVVSSPTLIADGSIVVVGSDDGAVYGLDAQDGTLAWRAFRGLEKQSSAVAIDSRVFIGCMCGALFEIA